MIELTEEQRVELLAPEPEILDPQTQTVYALVRKDVYERMKDMLYDDSPWTAEERDALAWEAGQAAGWPEMDEYDNDCLKTALDLHRTEKGHEHP